jgi:hypothetical protein
VGAGDVGIVAYVASKASVCVLADFEPRDDLVLLAFGEGLLEGGETGEGPVCACDFEVFGEVFTD